MCQVPVPSSLSITRGFRKAKDGFLYGFTLSFSVQIHTSCKSDIKHRKQQGLWHSLDRVAVDYRGWEYSPPVALALQVSHGQSVTSQYFDTMRDRIGPAELRFRRGVVGVVDV